MEMVLIMLSTIFWAVPAFSRVDPVSTSGPHTSSMGKSAYFAIEEFLLHTMQPVVQPICFAYFRPPIT